MGASRWKTRLEWVDGRVHSYPARMPARIVTESSQRMVEIAIEAVVIGRIGSFGRAKVLLSPARLPVSPLRRRDVQYTSSSHRRERRRPAAIGAMPRHADDGTPRVPGWRE